MSKYHISLHLFLYFFLLFFFFVFFSIVFTFSSFIFQRNIFLLILTTIICYYSSRGKEKNKKKEIKDSEFFFIFFPNRKRLSFGKYWLKLFSFFCNIIQCCPVKGLGLGKRKGKPPLTEKDRSDLEKISQAEGKLLFSKRTVQENRLDSFRYS